MSWSQWEKVSGFSFTDLIYEKRHRDAGGGVARVTINRPEKLNSLTIHTTSEIGDALDDASHDETIGVVVITGAGERAFSTGIDVNAALSGEGRQVSYRARHVSDWLRLCRKPILSAVKGYAIGMGCVIVSLSDFVIASDKARFGHGSARVGTPADGYYLYYDVQLVGARKAREIWMLGRQYSAQEALEMGWINKIVPLAEVDAEVDRWCDEILNVSPTCISVIKAAFDMEMDYSPMGRFSSMMAPHYFESEESKEGWKAVQQRRKPNFWQAKDNPGNID